MFNYASQGTPRRGALLLVRAGHANVLQDLYSELKGLATSWSYGVAPTLILFDGETTASSALQEAYGRLEPDAQTLIVVIDPLAADLFALVDVTGTSPASTFHMIAVDNAQVEAAAAAALSSNKPTWARIPEDPAITQLGTNPRNHVILPGDPTDDESLTVALQAWEPKVA